MRSTPESGGCLYVFQSSSKYYIWNPIEGEICEIITSVGLAGVVTGIAKLGFGSLKVAEVQQVSSD
jgi:hypothetical protein